MTTRTCGSCTLCCEVMAVLALDKPQHTRCVHQGAGCAIYATRPGACQAFECAWLTDGRDHGLGLTEKERPELTGIVLVIPALQQGAPTILAHQAHEGAADSYWGARLVRRLAKRRRVAVTWKDEVVRVVG